VTGIGKTTLVRKVCDLLRKKEVLTRGFYTEERRVSGKRKGFDVITMNGRRGPLASLTELV